jgi:Glycosyltransferase WbsX
MFEECSTRVVDAFAYYLPQFYPVPLNSVWWGDGYTEWSALLTAQRGCRSPKGTTISPGALGFYDLRLRDTRRLQAELARGAGLGSFCIYHYFSKGERLLNEVVDAILEDGEPDFPFFFCWANHDWTLGWKGKPEVVIWEQRYERPGDDQHIDWLLGAFHDRRYFKIGNAPVLAVFQPEAVPRSRDTFTRWRQLCVSAGFSGLVILGVSHSLSPAPAREIGLDRWIQSGPLLFPTVPGWRRVSRAFRSPGAAWRFARYQDYPVSADMFSRFLEESRGAGKGEMVPTVVGSWNNVGRRSRRAWYLEPDLNVFQRDVESAVRAAPVVASPDGARRLLAVNAWNEWGEAMAVEPSNEHGDQMLKILAEALKAGAAGP